ncbi:MAG TPA: hypothetical protein VGN93_11240 [Shinella sp.]|jgi:hypothetical protein|uniref:hypothetical protein n=1 Tax=Shinella sp. TaxID=1870904 RepID=UPI0029AE1FF5|nr:hypothetical protein [Shinella sp.]MDX3975539.1 hypothetical protein [Shinella sp.]HEV7247551.1 hypothetical protein [Shinella sp.]
MLKVVRSITLFLTVMGGLAPAHAGEPGEVVAGIYAKHPWTDLPPGGPGAWYVETAAAWESGASHAGMAFLLGAVSQVEKVDTEIVAAGTYEAKVRATLTGKDGPVQVLNFGMIGDDDEDDRWRIIEVFTDDGKYLSAVLAHK